MRRLWIVVTVSLVMLLALLGVRNFDSSREPSDEILAYEVDADKSVSVTLSGGIDRVLITTWLLVPIDAPEPLFPYGIETVVSNLEGATVLTRRFETRSRLSDLEGELTAQARVADAQAWVCEPRSFELETDALAGEAGVLRVRALPGLNSRLLLRMTHKEERGELEQRILERALGPLEMRRIMAGRSSLGFFDLPAEQRRGALSAWERRLTAQGAEGRDYRSRRLLIGNPTAAPRAERWVQRGMDTSPEEWLALNLTGALALRVHAEPGTAIWLTDGSAGATRHVVTESAGLDLQLPDNGLRTVTVYAEARARVALSAPTPEGWLFGEPPLQIAERFEVLPDLRKRNHYRLDPKLPVGISVAKAQRWVGLDVRGEVAPGQRERQLRFKVVWFDVDGKPIAELDYAAHAERSLFEHLNASLVTDLATVRLRTPAGAARLEVFGEPSFAAAVFVEEPWVEAAVRSPPYDLEPPPGFVWRYTPQTLSPIAGVRPDNLSELRSFGREQVLYEQVRLEPIEGRGARIAPRVLKPAERTMERALLSPETPTGTPLLSSDEALGLGSNAATSSGNWVLLSSSDQAQRLRFEAPPAAAAAELEWSVLAPKKLLGDSFSLLVDGQVQLSTELSFTSMRGNQLISIGEHTLTLQADPGVLLALRARPAGDEAGLAAFKQQSVFNAPARTGLTFPFQREASELLSLVVVLAVQGDTRTANLRYAIDYGQPRLHDSFFHRQTEPGAVVPVAFGQYSRGIVWDADNGGRGKTPDALARVVIPLGDDLREGKHTVTLSLSGLRENERGWLRAVLVGRKLDASLGGEITTRPSAGASRQVP